MVARNATRNTVIAANARVARSLWARTRGLMMTPSLPEGEGLLIKGCRSIHTHWMRYPIDALFLDGEGQVVAAINAMPPWRVGRYYARARDVLELPAGTLQRTGTREGDRISFEGEGGRSV